MAALEIDGSFGEGGGQLTRCAMALSAISGQPIRLFDIRKRRPKPGLMAQHLTALRAVAALCNGELEGAKLGATEIRFRPGRILGGEHRFDVGTAGSVTLVLQALLPVALHAAEPSELHVTGGTDVRMAPPADYLELVFLPWLRRMGAKVDCETLLRGYFPRGGGSVRASVKPIERLEPLVVEQPGDLLAVRGIAHAAHLPEHIPERMAGAASECLSELGPTEIRARRLPDHEAVGPGGALVLVAETEHARLGSAAVAERGVRAEKLGRDAGQALRSELEAGATVDVHAADQLLVYAARAAGESRFAVRSLSRHARTVMWLCERFLSVRFVVEADDGRQRVSVVPG